MAADADHKSKHRNGKKHDGQPSAVAHATAAKSEANPIALVAGGLALGVVAGALLPRSRRERELLAPVGARIGAAVTAAGAAAKEAGQAELDQLGINKAAARDQARTLLDGLMQAASSAGNAAVKAAANAGNHPA